MLRNVGKWDQVQRYVRIRVHGGGGSLGVKVRIMLDVSRDK